MQYYSLAFYLAIAFASNDSDRFTFAAESEPRYATPVPKPTGTPTTYAPPYSSLTHLFSTQPATTQWGKWDPNATVSASDINEPYGNYSWSKMWEQASLYNYTFTGLYSTTVEPTSLPTEELVRPPEDPFLFETNLTFSKDFIFGVAGSAAQIEGAIADEGRSPTIMEVLTGKTKPENFVTNENYYLYKQDIARLAAMGVEYYSFTIPWTRILPFVFPGTPVNQQGLDHYDDVVNTCLEYGIKPMITLTHFDSPLAFISKEFPISSAEMLKTQNRKFPLLSNGGYANETFVEAFVNYGKIVLTHFADRVPMFVGFNEPMMYAGYPLGVKNVVDASAQLYKFYHEDIGATGQFGIKLNDNFGIPRNSSNPDDVAAANRVNEMLLGSFANPLFLGEDYPQSWIDTFTSYNGTVDPENKFLMTPDELKAFANSSDFFGIDPYTYSVITPPIGGIEACAKNSSHPAWPYCVNLTEVRDDGWKAGYRSQSYVYITPVEHRQYMNYLWKTWKTPILIGEFGFPEWREGEKELGDQLYDTARSIYYKSFLDATLKAIHYDNVSVAGAFAWSFADNWEFGDYEQQFGLQVVNRTTQERFFKKSFFDMMEYVEERRET